MSFDAHDPANEQARMKSDAVQLSEAQLLVSEASLRQLEAPAIEPKAKIDPRGSQVAKNGPPHKPYDAPFKRKKRKGGK